MRAFRARVRRWRQEGRARHWRPSSCTSRQLSFALTSPPANTSNCAIVCVAMCVWLCGIRATQRVAMGTKVWLSRVAGQDYLDVAAKMVKGRRPDLEDYLTPYREAADPENCIEDQYNPKHNKMYVWKGQRLLATEHLQLMSEAPPPFDELIAKLDAKLAKAKAASTGTAAPAPGAAAADAAADAPPPAANGADTTAAAKDEAGGSGSKRTERDEAADAGEQPANGDASKPPRPAKRARTGDAEA